MLKILKAVLIVILVTLLAWCLPAYIICLVAGAGICLPFIIVLGILILPIVLAIFILKKKLKK